MTQIIGIICKENIVFASEKRITLESRIDQDANKITILQFANGVALIGEAGVRRKSARAISFLKEMAKGKSIEDQFTVSRMAEEAMKKVRQEVLGSLQKREYSLREQIEFFRSEDNKCGLLIAHYYAPPQSEVHWTKRAFNPIMWKITLSDTVAAEEGPIGVLGSADDLARFILKPFPCDKLLQGQAVCLIIDALQRIIEYETSCGGSIDLHIMYPNIFEKPCVMTYGDPIFSKMANKVRAVREDNFNAYKDRIMVVMSESHKEIVDELLSKAAKSNSTSAIGNPK